MGKNIIKSMELNSILNLSIETAFVVRNFVESIACEDAKVN